MTIIGTFPATIANGQVEDATVVMSLFSWIQAQTNGNACPATIGALMLKADGFGGTIGATDGTDFLSPNTVAASLKPVTTSGSIGFLPAGLSTTVITALIVGQTYMITTMGTSTAAMWITAGAVAGTVGEVFTATAVSTGTGTATFYNSIQSALREDISAARYGMSPSATAAVNVAAFLAACTAAGSNGRVVIPTGIYPWSTCQVSTYGLTIISYGATLQGPASGAQPYLLSMNNSFQSIQGQLNLDTQFNASYTCAFNVMGNYCTFNNIIVKNTLLAFTQGVTGTNPTGLSENRFVNCSTNGCCRALEMYGIFTTASFEGCILVGGESNTWTGLDVTSVKLFGAYGYFSNCEFGQGMVYSGTYPQFEVNQSLYSGSYYSGSLIVTGCDIESIKPLLRITNLATTPIAANAARVIITNNRIDCYYSVLTAHSVAIPNTIYSNNYYNGRLVVNSNRIYFDTPLGAVFPVSLGALTKAQINFEDFITYTVDTHYGTGVATWAGLPPQFSLRSVFSAHRASAFSPASGTIIPFDTVDTGPNGNSFVFNAATGSYNTSTGVFTAPTGGLSSVMIVWNWNVPTMNNASSACFILYNSSAQGIVNRRIANTTPVVPAGQLTAILPEMLAGDTISCEIYTNVGALAMDVSTPSYNNLNIMAMVQTPNA